MSVYGKGLPWCKKTNKNRRFILEHADDHAVVFTEEFGGHRDAMTREDWDRNYKPAPATDNRYTYHIYRDGSIAGPFPCLEYDNATGLPKVKEKTVTDINVGEDWARYPGETPRTVRDLGETFVVYGFGDSSVSFAEERDEFLAKNTKVEPGLQVGDVLRRNLVDGDELYVVLGVSTEGFSAESPRGGPMTAALPPAPWWERTDYKVPVLREGQPFNVATNGSAESGGRTDFTKGTVFNRGGRLVFPIHDNGKTVELPCPTKEL